MIHDQNQLAHCTSEVGQSFLLRLNCLILPQNFGDGLLACGKVLMPMKGGGGRILMRMLIHHGWLEKRHHLEWRAILIFTTEHCHTSIPDD